MCSRFSVKRTGINTHINLTSSVAVSLGQDNAHLQVIGNINQKKGYALVGFEKNTLQRDSMGKEPLIAFNHEWVHEKCNKNAKS